jgi:hypothetical protein
MSAKLAYEVKLADKDRLFAETYSGALDYEGRFDKLDAAATAAKILGHDPGPLVDELMRIQDYEDDLYLAER